MMLVRPSGGASSGTRPFLARAALALLVLVTGNACGSDAPPLLHRLAAGTRAASPSSATLALPGTVLLAHDPEGVWLETTLAPEAWTATGLPGVWRQARQVAGVGAPGEGTAQRLLQDGREAYRFVQLDISAPHTVRIEPGTFSASGDAVFLVGEPGAPAPAAPLLLREFLARGVDDGTAWRVAVGEVEAEGLPLLTGESLELDVPPTPSGSTLTFALTARPLRVLPPAAAPAPRARLEVFLEGAPLATLEVSLEASQNGGPCVEPARWRLPALRQGGRLTFSLKGDPALAALHVPRLQPREIGRPGARPWRSTRPDLVLLVADTFRADNLAHWGGDPRIAPELDALAARGRRYLRTWAPSPWTLPSHAALFSGLLPPAAGCMDFFDRLSSEAETLAEALRAIGYRTVAITDRGFVSREHGLAQGFEWFQEVTRRGAGSLEETLEDVRTQLALDDGRPLFLFVQTYRAHTPYEVSPASRAALADLFVDEEDFPSLIARLPMEEMGPSDPRFDEYLQRMHALYRGAARDTSRGLGRLVELLESAGVLDDGHLFLTSDHGEAFGEHGLYGHGSTVREPQVHVPLVHVGPGIAPEDRLEPASLLDLPTTLVRLAGIVPPAAWTGSDLDALPPERVLFSFVGDHTTGGDRGGFAARREDRKLYFRSGLAAPAQAYDLAHDPGEARDLATDPQPPGWPAAFEAEVRSAHPALTAQRFGRSAAQLSPGAQQQLRALGYAAGESH